MLLRLSSSRWILSLTRLRLISSFVSPGPVPPIPPVSLDMAVFFDQTREHVLELSEFHLDLPVAAMGTLGEDVQDHLGAVDDLQFREVRNGADLGRREFVIENEQVGADLQGPDHHVRELSFPHEVLRVDLLAVLRDGVENLDPAGLGKLLELGKGILAVSGVRLHADEDGAFARANPASALPAGDLVLQVLDEPREVKIHPGRVRGSIWSQ